MHRIYTHTHTYIYIYIYIYICVIKLLQIRYLNKESNLSLTDLMRNSGVNQPCSYDDSVTHKHKIKIEATLKIVQKIMPRIEFFVCPSIAYLLK